MPASKTSLTVTRHYQTGMGNLRRRAQAEARQTWSQVKQSDLDGSYQVGMLTLTVATLQRDAARLSAGYIQAFVSSELGRPIDVPMVDAQQVGKARNGDELRKSLRSPLIGVKVGIRDGKDVSVALAEGGRALERVVGLATDTAAREALRLASDHSSHILGWRRAVKGTCGACMGAATAEMHPADGELDIHPNCECVAEPVVKAEPYVPKKGERIEVQNGSELVNKKWVRLEDSVRGKVVKFDDKTVMINAGTPAKPRWVSAGRANAYKPGKVITKPLDELAHGENTFIGSLTKKELNAVDSYKGYGYKQINGQLRAGKPGGETVRQLDSALQKGSLGKDTTLYRSFHFPADRGLGDIFADPAFMSTSAKRNVSERFTQIGGKRSLVRINAPKGTRGGHIPGQSEAEFILPRNTRLRITGDKIEGGVRVLDAEILA